MLHYENNFYREKEECSCGGYMRKMSNRFNHGFAVNIGRRRLVVPLRALVLFKAPILASTLLYFPSAPDLISALCGFLIFFCGMVITLWAGAMADRVERLSRGIDSWQDYRLLGSETEDMRHRTAAFINTASSYYIRALTVGVILISNSYIPKLITKNTLKPEDILVFPCWSPFSFSTWAEAIFVQIIQTIDIYFLTFIYERVIFYFIAATLMIGKQVQLIGKAFNTMDSRVTQIVSSMNFRTEKERELQFTVEMIKEIKACAEHYQNLIRCSLLLDESFEVIVDLSIYIAMWLWCFFAVQLTTNDRSAFSTQGLTLLVESVGTSFLCSALVEAFVSNFEEFRNTVYFSDWHKMPLPCQKLIPLFQAMLVRSPCIRTSLGTHVNLDNFSRLVNRAYCYFGFIITMKTGE